jgi:hypothetical protein
MPGEDDDLKTVDPKDDTGGDDPKDPKGDDPKGDDPKGDDPKGDDPKGDDPKGDDPKGDDPKGDDPKGSFKFNFKEGVSVSDELSAKFTDFINFEGTEQEKADKLTGLYDDVVGAVEKQQRDDWVQVRKDWEKELKEDKEFGGKNYDENVLKCKAVIKKFADFDMAEFLDLTGYGDNPGLAKMLIRIHKAFSEDKVVEGLGIGDEEKSAAEVLYPDQGKEKK